MNQRLFGSLLLALTLLWSCTAPQLMTQRVPGGDLPRFLTYPNPQVPTVSAHRGGGYPGYPENCLESFAFILRQAPALIECDVRMSADSVLLLMHDRSLDRTTTGDGRVAQRRWSEMKDLYLVDNQGTSTRYRIPTLAQALRWARRHRAILTLDVKRGVPFDRVIAAVQAARAQGYAAIITYNLADAEEVYRLNPNLAISMSLRNETELKAALQSDVPPSHMLAFTGTRLSPPTLYQKLHAQGIFCILGTLGNLDRRAEARGDSLYTTWLGKGADILATDRPIEVRRATQQP